jgi:hypothetical protein
MNPLNLLTRDELLDEHRLGKVSNGVKALVCLNSFSTCLTEIQGGKVVAFHVYLNQDSEKLVALKAQAEAQGIQVHEFSEEQARAIILERLKELP